jgi:hypothetical protein
MHLLKQKLGYGCCLKAMMSSFVVREKVMMCAISDLLCEVVCVWSQLQQEDQSAPYLACLFRKEVILGGSKL